MPSNAEVAVPIQAAAFLVVQFEVVEGARRKLIYAFEKFFQDTDGRPSAIRFVMILWALVTLALWAYVLIRIATLIGLPDTVVQMIPIVLMGKAVQKFSQNPTGGS